MAISLIFHSHQIIFIHWKSRIATAIRGLILIKYWLFKEKNEFKCLHGYVLGTLGDTENERVGPTPIKYQTVTLVYR